MDAAREIALLRLKPISPSLFEAPSRKTNELATRYPQPSIPSCKGCRGDLPPASLWDQREGDRRGEKYPKHAAEAGEPQLEKKSKLPKREMPRRCVAPERTGHSSPKGRKGE